MFVYELSGCVLESRCYNFLRLRFTCLKAAIETCSMRSKLLIKNVFFVTLNISFSSVSTVYFEQEKLAGLTN